MEATNATLQTPDERTRLRDELLRLIIKSEAERRKTTQKPKTSIPVAIGDAPSGA